MNSSDAVKFAATYVAAAFLASDDFGALDDALEKLKRPALVAAVDALPSEDLCTGTWARGCGSKPSFLGLQQ